jgi:hypothetical protein
MKLEKMTDLDEPAITGLKKFFYLGVKPGMFSTWPEGDKILFAIDETELWS